jgi:outer membrane protein assembly factor BamB
VYALTAPTFGTEGVKRWSYITGAAVRSSPLVDSANVVYVGSVDRVFYALRAPPTGTTGGASSLDACAAAPRTQLTT